MNPQSQSSKTHRVHWFHHTSVPVETDEAVAAALHVATDGEELRVGLTADWTCDALAALYQLDSVVLKSCEHDED